MTAALLAALAVVVVAARLLVRRRRGHGAVARPASSFDAHFGDVGLVAAREIRTRVRGRLFRGGTLIILAVVAGAIIIPTLSTSSPSTTAVAVVGPLPTPLRSAVAKAGHALGTRVRFLSAASEAAAKADLREGRASVAIVDAAVILVEQPASSSSSSTSSDLAQASAADLGLIEGLEAAHLSPTQAAAVSRARALPIHSLSRRTTSNTDLGTLVIGLILTFVMLTQYNAWILIGVMEEKSSRVIEVLLAAVRPIRLLTGKVLGIGLVAFAQAGLVVAFALLLATAVGSELIHGAAPVVLVASLVWLVLGYAFYCWVFAAAGSLAERQDQIQTMTLPLSLPVIFAYVMSLTAASSGHASTFFEVLAYLPPTAPLAMPTLVGLGVVSLWQVVCSAAITVVCTVGLARLAAGVYRRAVLRTGSRVKLRQLFSEGR